MKRTACLALVLIAGCAAPRGEPYRPPPTEADSGVQREPSEDELRELLGLAEVALVGRVVERRVEPAGTFHQVQVLELLRASPILEEGGDRWPHAAGQTVLVSEFLYRPGRPLQRVARLRPPERYVFFLSRMERDGAWLNLEDASCLRLPDADDTLRAVRRLAGEGARGSQEPEGR